MPAITLKNGDSFQLADDRVDVVKTGSGKVILFVSTEKTVQVKSRGKTRLLCHRRIRPLTHGDAAI